MKIDELGEEGQAFLTGIVTFLTGRKPSAADLEWIMDRSKNTEDISVPIWELYQSAEVQGNLEKLQNVPMFVPPGHYYSPIVDISLLDEYKPSNLLKDVNINAEEMLFFFKELSTYFENIKFPDEPEKGKRYHLRNDFYGPGDALILSAMLQHFKPANIIEVGSGFSSAVMLDTIDAINLKVNFTFIDPYPQRLRDLLSKKDNDATTIIESTIQRVPPETFDILENADLAFFDTTHISKTGSDVNHEVFEILPRLKSGVIIHFHDVFDNFEYPESWRSSDNRSWNEIYFLRAFLMNNPDYEILFLNDLVFQRFQNEVNSISSLFASNPGGGLWLRKNVPRQRLWNKLDYLPKGEFLVHHYPSGVNDETENGTAPGWC